MTQVLGYDGGDAVLYWTDPGKAGTAEFERVAKVPLTDGVVEGEFLVLAVPGGPVVGLPLAGDAVAQEAHARFRMASPDFAAVTTKKQALASLAADVGELRITEAVLIEHDKDAALLRRLVEEKADAARG